MANSIAQKFRIKEDYKLLVLNQPPEFKKDIAPLPEGARILNNSKTFDQVHWFVKDKAQMEAELDGVLAMLKPNVVCWIYYPKGSSKIQTDLTRDKGWEELLKHNELQWVSLVSFNDTWSAFGMRLKTETDKKKEAAPPKERPIFDYIDPATKTVILPEDLQAMFKKAKKEFEFFETLSFTNKKEYIEWIVSAKREETRNTRVQETIERLAKKWKNPRNM
jgi:hypothetical protein